MKTILAFTLMTGLLAYAQEDLKARSCPENIATSYSCLVKTQTEDGVNLSFDNLNVSVDKNSEPMHLRYHFNFDASSRLVFKLNSAAVAEGISENWGEGIAQRFIQKEKVVCRKNKIVITQRNFYYTIDNKLKNIGEFFVNTYNNLFKLQKSVIEVAPNGDLYMKLNTFGFNKSVYECKAL